MIGIIQGAVLDALAVLVPVSCAGCGADDRGLCAACRAALVPTLSRHVLHDGTPVVTALAYRGVARRVILALKEQGRTDVARALSIPLRSAVSEAIAVSAEHGPVELATVPTSRASYRHRGYDPVALLLRRAGFGAPARPLVHTRQTEHQKALDRSSRSRNLAGSLCAKHPLDGRRFVLVDDVMTTGATLDEATRAIRAGGGEVVMAATLAYTARLFETRGT